MVLAVPTQDTFTVGQLLTAASMNKNVRDGVSFLANVPLAVLTQSVVQSIPTSAWTAVTFDTETADTYAEHSTATNTSRYTAVVAGWRNVAGQITFAASTTGRRLASLWVNGTQVQNTQAEASTTASTCTVASEGLVYLNVGDYVEIRGYQTSGGSLSTGAANCAMNVNWAHS